jgi:TonB family protein
MSARKKRNSSKINLTISIVFHSLLVVGLIFFAAREGILGKKLKEITVTMVPKDKKPEPPKEKPAEPKLEQPKPEDLPRAIAAAAPKTGLVAPPPAESQASVAPAAVTLPAFEFNDGAHEVQSISDPFAIYKSLVEHGLRSRWNRPDNIEDERYVAEVELTVDPDGTVEGSRWIKGSGDARWDASVKAAVAQLKAISRPPPKGFPRTFAVRFDVETTASDGIELTSR